MCSRTRQIPKELAIAEVKTVQRNDIEQIRSYKGICPPNESYNLYARAHKQ